MGWFIAFRGIALGALQAPVPDWRAFTVSSSSDYQPGNQKDPVFVRNDEAVDLCVSRCDDLIQLWITAAHGAFHEQEV